MDRRDLRGGRLVLRALGDARRSRIGPSNGDVGSGSEVRSQSPLALNRAVVLVVVGGVLMKRRNLAAEQILVRGVPIDRPGQERLERGYVAFNREHLVLQQCACMLVKVCGPALEYVRH